MSVSAGGTFIFTIGATFSAGLNYKGPPPTYTPIDCTGKSFSLLITPNPSSNSVFPATELSLSTAGSPTVNGSSLVWVLQSSGTSQLTIVAADIATLTFTEGQWWLYLIDGSTTTPLANGSIIVSI